MNVKALRITSFDDSFPVRAAISPFGKWLAVIYSDSRLKLFLVSEKDGQVNLMADKNWFSGVNDVAFSADPGSGKVTEMALATNEGITRVNLISRESLKPVTSAGARSISYSGAFAILGLENGSFQIWRLDSEPRLVQETATGHASAITTSRANRSGEVYLIDEG
ncbi:MAG: hypothetical protein IAF58_05470, partial [Leptolyngbya sp.]|nr:hypothetical protein [Candidatus Melainabacteria bacterium]